MKDNSRFCILAWMHLASNSSGYLRLCCNSTPGNNLILGENGKPFKLDQNFESLDTVYNSKWMRDIRKDMLQGNKVSICQRCYTEEETGVRSARQAWNEKFKASFDEAIEQTSADGSFPFKAKYVDLRLGNLCNLKCRMCNPYASRKWLEDWNKVAGFESLDDAERKRLSSMDWFKSDNFVRNLREILDSVEEIYFTGGEPLLINKHFELLQFLIDEKRADKIALKYNTNLTFIPEKIFALWRPFKKVTVNTSIDGTEAVNDYIRHPSRWGEISANLRQMDEFLHSAKNVKGSIHTTVQLYNLEHLVDLFEYVMRFKAFQRFPYLNILNHPAPLNIRNAPRALKNEVTQKVSGWSLQHAELFKNESQFSKLQSVLDYMNSKDLSLQKEFIKYSQEIDAIRGENYQTVAPRLAQALERMPLQSMELA